MDKEKLLFELNLWERGQNQLRTKGFKGVWLSVSLVQTSTSIYFIVAMVAVSLSLVNQPSFSAIYFRILRLPLKAQV